MPGASVMTIASFPTSSGDGTDPDGQLFMDSNGDLFGATVHGGANDIGTTYEIAKVASGFSTTPSFLADIPTGLNTLLGVPNLSADANGDLFGLEITGGTGSLGAVVEFPAAGGGPNIVANFAGGAGGAHPGGVLLVDASGNLFGTTASGGTHSAGTVFEIQKTASGYATTPTVLTSFGSGVTPNGAGNLVEDAAGDLFGTTTADTVFEVQKTGSSYAAPVFISFPAGTQIGGSLTIDANGDIFGTTISGGANNDGTVFEIVKNTSTPITLASFSLADGELSVNRPKTLIVDSNGDLFGTTDPSTQNSGGVVFEIVKTSSGYDSTPTIVINFNGSGDGALGANLVADPNGNLFGTTPTGGANNTGSVFEITDSGYVPPLLLTAGANASYVAGAAAVALDPGLSITGLSLAGATVSIGAGRLAGDALSVGSPQGGITSTYDAGTGVLTLSGAASRPAYQAELDSVTFAGLHNLRLRQRHDFKPHDHLVRQRRRQRVHSSDQHRVGQPPPSCGDSGRKRQLRRRSSARRADAGLTVADAAAVNLSAATVSISAGFILGDTLSVGSPQTGIASQCNAATGVLTLSGAASLAAYKTELDSIAYASANATTSS